MTRMIHLFAAAALLAPAAAGAATYSAKPAVPVTAKRIIARDISWACGPEACAGATDNGRPVVLCQGLAKKAGRIESFLVDGRALGAVDLDKCNAAAKGAAPSALARN
jgi:hypothetical protein